MKVFKKEAVVMFDVDETLIMHNMENNINAIEVINPYNYERVKVVPHTEHCEILKMHAKRGFLVGVWSAAGALWAEAVINKLELELNVDFIIAKPLKVCDDLPVNEIIVNRFYVPYREKEEPIKFFMPFGASNATK